MCRLGAVSDSVAPLRPPGVGVHGKKGCCVSYLGSLVIACIHPTPLPPRLRSFDDLAAVDIDEQTAVYVGSRNGWINNRVEELVECGHIVRLPTSQSPAVVVSAEDLRSLTADLASYLERLPREPDLLPEGAREQAQTEDARCLTMAPTSLDAAVTALHAATARDEDAEGLETLVCLLWCVRRLAEHAAVNGLHLVCVRSQ